MIFFAILLMLSCGMARGQCLIVDGEWVTAKDVAERLPFYAEVDPDRRLVRAPFPGARRIVNAASLPALDGEEAHGTTPFCVERRLRTLSREAFTSTLRQSLSGKDGAEIDFELVDYDRSMLPSGSLEFLVQSLPPPILDRPDDSVLWRGKVLYAEARSVPVWARVRLWIEGEVCVLTRDVARGEELRVEDCKMSRKRYPPFGPAPLRQASALERTIAVRRMKAEEPIYPALVVRKPEVEAGKTVDLEVISGAALLRFQARAAGSGRRGDPVAVTNPANGRRLQGTVVGQGSVEVRVK